MELERMRALLGKRLRIQISDGRLIEGDFQCLDREMNIVLGCAIEYYAISDVKFIESNGLKRSLGMATVPGAHIITCHVQRNSDTDPVTVSADVV